MGPIVLFETSRVRLVEYSRYRDSTVYLIYKKCYMYLKYEGLGYDLYDLLGVNDYSRSKPFNKNIKNSINKNFKKFAQ